MERTLQGRIASQLELDPNRPALALVDGHGAFRWQTRAEFSAAAAGTAAVLAELGLAPGGVCVLVSVDPLVCARGVLAVLQCGGVPLLVAPPAIQGVNSSLKDVVLDVVRRTGARLAVLPAELRAAEDELRGANRDAHFEFGYERLLTDRPGANTGFAECAADDVAALQLTSGTTGFPRIAVWKQAAVVAALDGMARGMQVTSDDVYLNWTPLYHDMGLVNNFLLCQAHGIPLALLSPLDVVRKPSLWLRALHDTGATTTWSPNFGYALAAERVRREELDGIRLDRVRGFWNAAERVHLDTCKRFHQRFEPWGVKWKALKANFGCVETIGGVTFTDPDGALIVERADLPAPPEEGLDGPAPVVEGPRRSQWLVGCGRPYPGLELLIFGPEGHPLPDGSIGEVAFRTQARLGEYLGQPDETAATLRGNHVFTGDLGYQRDGEFFWTGRTSERINLQGKKLDPSELEHVLFPIEGLRTGCFVAFGVEDEARGTELLVLVAEVEPEFEAGSAKVSLAVRAAVATQLGVTVEELVLVPKGELTKTSSGKRRHRYFARLYREGRLHVLHRSGAGRLG